MKDRILDYIVENFAESQKILSDDNLLETGIIDSMGLMRLVAFIENEFGIKVPAEDLIIDHFISVDAMESYLNSKADA